jgi:hypothetical protein
MSTVVTALGLSVCPSPFSLPRIQRLSGDLCGTAMLLIFASIGRIAPYCFHGRHQCRGIALITADNNRLLQRGRGPSLDSLATTEPRFLTLFPQIAWIPSTRV